MVKWAAETKLFLLTQSDLLELKTEAIRSNLPAEDFNLSLEQIEARESFSHAELARWQNYFLRNEREDLAKRINPKVGDEAGTYKSGEINDLVEKIKTYSQDQFWPLFLPREKNSPNYSANIDPALPCLNRRKLLIRPIRHCLSTSSKPAI